MRSHSTLFLTTLFALSLAATAHAQSSRTWVSSTGVDTNTCTRTAPCHTFNRAISVTSAGGEVSVVDNANYGTATITKSITIDGFGAMPGVIAAAGNYTFVIQAAATDRVILRNLSLNGNGAGQTLPAISGIDFRSGGSLIVENCDIWGYGAAGIVISATAPADFFFTRTHVFANVAGNADGIIFNQTSTTAEATIDDCTISDVNGRGIYANNGTKLSIRNTRIEHSGKGVVVDQGTLATNVTIENTSIKGCTTGLRNGTGNPTTTLNNVSIEQNSIGIDFNAGVINSYGNNKIAGNGVNNGGGFTSVLPQ